MASRRQFLAKLTAAVAATAGGVFAWKSAKPAAKQPIIGALLGPNIRIGHALRDGKALPAPELWHETETLIVGGGMSGLIAARSLHQRQKDFLLIELEDILGGNAIGGQSEISPYPWGAHYIPIPNLENHELLAFFEEIGVITGYDSTGIPIYREENLCFAPHERLFIHGRWQEGLLPVKNIPIADRQQIEAFMAEMNRLKSLVGKDRKPLFTFPAKSSSQDAEWLALDKISFREWLLQQGWNSEYLHWYANYCTRDDYGAPHDAVSAWAGIHYFAARRGVAANAAENSVLTWAEGNHWVVKRIVADLPANALKTRIAAFHIHQNSDKTLEVLALDTVSQQTVGFRCRNIILAVPHFVAKRLTDFTEPTFSPTHYPWLVANIHLHLPSDAAIETPSWDNVAYNRPSLGYVVATHQQLQGHSPQHTIFTYYHPLCALPAIEARQQAFTYTRSDCQALVLREMQHMHPDISLWVRHMDCRIWGHGMVCPTVDFLWHTHLPKPTLPHIYVAHTDYAGISVFEEAFYQGIAAANNII